MKHFIFLTLPLIFLSGCTTPYSRDTIDFHKQVMSIEKNKTTQNELLDRFGEPDTKTTINGQEVWTYWRQQLSSYSFVLYTYYPGTKNADTYYRVFFNKDKTVSNVNTLSNGYRDKPKAVVRPVRSEFTDETLLKSMLKTD
ncbi:MAG: hypothetical protein LBH92_01415 [Bacteroidales bacterium]|jgi:hypothetical protein|nr:hypothetical protein [Bacteroidales bacterium]